jgi:hypothetical protein
MTSLEQMSVGEAISSLRDIVFILGILLFGWKIRGWVQPGIDFFKRANRFFDIGEQHIQRVESGMQMLLNNHLTHIQSDLGHISGRSRRDSAFTTDTHEEPVEVEYASSKQETTDSDGDSGTRTREA